MNSALLDREISAHYPEDRRATHRLGRHAARVRRGMRLSTDARSDRDAQMIVMRESGATLEVIGAAFGVTRERARQLLKRNGYSGTKAYSSVDPIAMMRLVRTSGVVTAREVATALGVSPQDVSVVLVQLGANVAVQRLFRMRRGGQRRAAHVAALRAFVAEHGRSPTGKEMGTSVGIRPLPGLPYAMALVKDFGSVPAAFAAAGIASRRIGGRGHAQRLHAACKRGHEFTPDNTRLWTSPAGKVVRYCRICEQRRDARYRANVKARRASLLSTPGDRHD